MMNEPAQQNVTITEAARINMPAVAIWSGVVVVVMLTAGAAATYFGIRSQIDSIGMAVASIEKDFGKIAARVETGPSRREYEMMIEKITRNSAMADSVPSRREFDLVLERVRQLENKLKE